jgi:branched-chain amino acid transport system ATP-binding protein
VVDAAAPVGGRTSVGAGRDGELVLAVERLQVRYGPALAVDGVSLDVPAGRTVALLGPNGAGKSSLARAVAGLVPATAGRVRFDGIDVTSWPAHRRRQAGLVLVPEGRGVFPGLSVRDNLRMALRGIPRVQRQEAMARTLSAFPVLGQRAEQRAGSLSGGEQQMLALARALATEPRLIVADELSLGLAPLVVDAVFQAMAEAKARGVGLLVIEQFVHRALALADHCVILRRGTAVWSGPAAEAGEAVLERYLGPLDLAS